MSFREYDVVRLRRPLPEHQLPAGAVGTVVMVHEAPPGYEVEFCDGDGVTLALVTLGDGDLEPAGAVNPQPAPRRFGLPSNRGDARTTWRWPGPPSPGAPPVLDIHLVRTLWAGSEHFPHASVVLRGVAIPRERLLALAVHLGTWLATQAPFELLLTEGPGLDLHVTVGPRDGGINSVTKPVFELTFDAGFALRTTWAYVVDETCIRIMRDELQAALTGPS